VQVGTRRWKAQVRASARRRKGADEGPLKTKQGTAGEGCRKAERSARRWRGAKSATESSGTQRSKEWAQEQDSAQRSGFPPYKQEMQLGVWCQTLEGSQERSPWGADRGERREADGSMVESDRGADVEPLREEGRCAGVMSRDPLREQGIAGGRSQRVGRNGME
jgi:hypothetical protein